MTSLDLTREDQLWERLREGNQRSSAHAAVRLADLLLSRREDGAAQQLLSSRLVQTHPAVAAAGCLRLARLCDRSGKKIEADAWYERSARLASPRRSAEVMIDLAARWLIVGERDRAMTTYRAIANAASDRHLAALAHYRLGHACRDANEWSASLRYWQLALDEADVELKLWVLIDCAETLGACDGVDDRRQAREMLVEVVTSDHPDLAPRAALALGRWCRAEGSPLDAYHHLQMVIDSEHPDYVGEAQAEISSLVDDGLGAALGQRDSDDRQLSWPLTYVDMDGESRSRPSKAVLIIGPERLESNSRDVEGIRGTRLGASPSELNFSVIFPAFDAALLEPEELPKLRRLGPDLDVISHLGHLTFNVDRSHGGEVAWPAALLALEWGQDRPSWSFEDLVADHLARLERSTGFTEPIRTRWLRYVRRVPRRERAGSRIRERVFRVLIGRQIELGCNLSEPDDIEELRYPLRSCSAFETSLHKKMLGDALADLSRFRGLASETKADARVGQTAPVLEKAVGDLGLSRLAGLHLTCLTASVPRHPVTALTAVCGHWASTGKGNSRLTGCPEDPFQIDNSGTTDLDLPTDFLPGQGVFGALIGRQHDLLGCTEQLSWPRSITPRVDLERKSYAVVSSRRSIIGRSAAMGKGNDSDRYVVPDKKEGGWKVVKEGHQRASARTETQSQAVGRAREIIDNLGGGEMHVANRTGQFSKPATQVGPGQKEGKVRDRR